MKRKAGEGWTDKDKSENVDFLKWAVSLSRWLGGVANSQRCSVVVYLLFVCSSSRQLNAPQTTRRASRGCWGSARLHTLPCWFPFDSLCLIFGMFSQTAAVVKSRIISEIFPRTNERAFWNYWWPVMEGASNSGGQYISYPPTTALPPLFAQPYLTFQPVHYSCFLSSSLKLYCENEQTRGIRFSDWYWALQPRSAWRR